MFPSDDGNSENEFEPELSRNMALPLPDQPKKAAAKKKKDKEPAASAPLATANPASTANTRMPEATISAILELAQLGRSLVGIRRGLVERGCVNSVSMRRAQQHRNTHTLTSLHLSRSQAGKPWPVNCDHGVVKRTLKKNGIDEPELDHNSDFEERRTSKRRRVATCSSVMTMMARRRRQTRT